MEALIAFVVVWVIVMNGGPVNVVAGLMKNFIKLLDRVMNRTK